MSRSHRGPSRRARFATALAASALGIGVLAAAQPAGAAEGTTFWQSVSDSGSPLVSSEGDTDIKGIDPSAQDHTFALSGSTAPTVTVTSPWANYSVTFRPPVGQSLSVGTYSGATETPTAQAPGLQVSMFDVTCTSVDGAFQIHEISRAAGQVTSLSASFRLRCNGSTAETRVAVAFETNVLPRVPTYINLITASTAYPGKQITVTYGLTTPLAPIPSPQTVTFTRTDGSGTIALPDRTETVGSFTDVVGSTSVTYAAAFAGTTNYFPSEMFRSIQSERLRTGIFFDAQRAPTVNDSASMAFTLSGVLSGDAVVSYERTDQLGTKTGTVKVNARGRGSIDYTPRAGGTARWTLTYAGDFSHLPTTATLKHKVEFLKPKLTIETDRRSVRHNSPVDVTVTLGKTYSNRTVALYVRSLKPSADKPGELLVRKNLTNKNSFTFTHVVKKNSRFVAVFEGDQKYDKVTPGRIVTAEAVMSLELKGATRKVGDVYEFADGLPIGRIDVRPGPGDRLCAGVGIQARVNGGWLRIAKAKCIPLSAEGTGIVELTGKWPKNTVLRMRASWDGSVSYGRTSSPWRYFRIT